MSHKRQDTYEPTAEWAKHLKKFGKARHSNKEKQAAKKRIRKELKEIGEG